MTELKPDTPHSEFSAQAKHYEMVADFYRGVGAVRDKGEAYLPKTSGMLSEQNANKAEKRYEAFVRRATFPGIFRHTVSSVVGITTSKEPEKIDLPWEGVTDVATRDGESLRGLQANTIRQLSTTGRIGLLTDLRSNDDETPVIVPYYANQIINWRTQVIGGRKTLTRLSLKHKERIEDGENFWDDEFAEVVDVYQLTSSGVTLRRFQKRRASQNQKQEWAEVSARQPLTRRQRRGAESISYDGGAAGFRLSEIPFTPITTLGLQIDPVDPPFLDLVYKLWDIYIGSANYREANSMYEPTPVFIGYDPVDVEEGNTPKHLGVGRAVFLPMGGDAKMLEYQGDTIKDIRQSLIDDAQEADRLAAQPFEQITSQAESGESKKRRAQAKTNVIREIHLSTAMGIQEALRKGARWTGDDDSKVFFGVSDDLEEVEMGPAELRELTASWLAGLMTDSDAHAQLKAGGKTQLTYEQWKVAREGGETGALPDGVAPVNADAV